MGERIDCPRCGLPMEKGLENCPHTGCYVNIAQELKAIRKIDMATPKKNEKLKDNPVNSCSWAFQEKSSWEDDKN